MLKGEQIFVICADCEMLRRPDCRGLVSMFEGLDLITSRTAAGRAREDLERLLQCSKCNHKGQVELSVAKCRGDACAIYIRSELIRKPCETSLAR